MSSCPFSSMWAVKSDSASTTTGSGAFQRARSDLQAQVQSHGLETFSFPRTISTPHLPSEASTPHPSSTTPYSTAKTTQQAPGAARPNITPNATSISTTLSQRLTRRQLRKLGKNWSLSEVRQHARKDDAWIAVDGKVYDITEHLLNHPGWEDSSAISTVLSILAHAGSDCSQEFREIHRPYPVAWRQLRAYYIGDLAPEEDNPICVSKS